MRIEPWALLVLILVGCDSPPTPMGDSGILKGHAREVTALAFAPDGKSIASRGGDAVKVWDVAGLHELSTFPIDGADFGSVAFAPDGRSVASNRAAGGAVAWNLASGRESTASDRPPGPPADRAWGLAYSPDGRTLAVGDCRAGSVGFATLRDIATGAGIEVGSIPGPVAAVVFAPDGKSIALKGLRGTIEVWGFPAPRLKAAIPAANAYMAPACFTPDGKVIASASDDRSVRLWSAESGAPIATLKGHLKAVLSIAIGPGGKTLASGDSGGTILLWDLDGRRPVARLVGHQGKVWAVAFAPDGKTVASAGEDRAVRLWDVSGP